MRASGHQQQTHYQRGSDKKDHEAYLPDDRGNSGPLAHPSEEPPQKRKGQRRRQAHSEASHAHHPHTFPCLAKPGGVKAHPHLGGPHQTGIGGQRLGAQSTYYDVGCFRIIAAGFAFLQVISQPKLLNVWHAFAQSDQLASFVMYIPCHVYASAPFSRAISKSNPRYSRDFTVPTGAPVTVAISSNAMPS